MVSPVSSISRSLALDASVVINLNASRHGRALLSTSGPPIVVVDVVEAEIGRGNRQKRHDKHALDELVAQGVITIVGLEDEGLTIFESLVVGSAVDTLDDGEAATIAYAVHTGATPVIDERKANALARKRFPGLRTLSTLDLFMSETAKRHLGPELLKEAVFMALLHGRMQVPKPHLEWVLELIGQERAAQCLSLPSFARIPRTTSPVL